MKKYLLFIICALISIFEIKANEPRCYVLVSPDHLNWEYKIGEKATFSISIFKEQNLLPNAVIDYEIGPEMYPTEVQKGIVLENGKITLSGTMKKAGFLRCKVTAHIDGRSYEGIATAAFEPEKIVPASKMPEDFEAYWKNTLDKARETPLETTMTLLDERCTELDNVYQVSFNTKQNCGRFYGILSIPKKAGLYPALIRVPGAGVRGYNGDTYTAPGKVITLEVGIHGIPVNLQESVYKDLFNGALKGYWTYGKDNRDKIYYNRVIVGVLRAVDLIYSLPQFNKEKLGITGSSQGGALSIIAAALDSRITCLAAVHPALCDHEAYFEKRACGWPHYFYYYGKPNNKELETVRYYDVVNFSRILKTPGWYSWGFNDLVCPPTSLYSAYNSIKAVKELHLYLNTGHYWINEQWLIWQEWLLKQLGIQ